MLIELLVIVTASLYYVVPFQMNSPISGRLSCLFSQPAIVNSSLSPSFLLPLVVVQDLISTKHVERRVGEENDVDVGVRAPATVQDSNSTDETKTGPSGGEVAPELSEPEYKAEGPNAVPQAAPRFLPTPVRERHRNGRVSLLSHFTVILRVHLCEFTYLTLHLSVYSFPGIR